MLLFNHLCLYDFINELSQLLYYFIYLKYNCTEPLGGCLFIAPLPQEVGHHQGGILKETKFWIKDSVFSFSSVQRSASYLCLSPPPLVNWFYYCLKPPPQPQDYMLQYLIAEKSDSGLLPFFCPNMSVVMLKNLYTILLKVELSCFTELFSLSMVNNFDSFLHLKRT